MSLTFNPFRNLMLTVSAIIVLFAFSACGDKNAQRFKEAAMNLDKTSHTLTDVYDYWPECGIRVTGSHLASLISLEELQKMLPCPLYVSGPHHDGRWDLKNENDFGHYNPKAIQYLANLAQKVVSDKKFVEMSKPLVDQYLFDKMLIMMVLHDALYDDNLPSMMFMDADVKTVRERILDELIENNGFCYDMSCFFQGMMHIDAASWTMNSSTEHFLYFWARRWKDGSIDQFYQALNTVFTAYYPEYEFHIVDYFYEDDSYYGDWEPEDEEGWFEGDEGWYYEGDVTGETHYLCDLEEDKPVADNERIKEKDAVNMFRTAATNLDKTSLVLANEFDYWPECGIRVMGGHLFSLISLRTLNRMLPCELYVSGPHHYNRWELNDPYDYGHYNPEAIQYLGQLAKKVVSDKKFIKNTRPLVDKYLKRQMLILKGLYDGMNDEEICIDKQAVLQDITNRKGNIYTGGNCPAGEVLESLDLEDGSFVYGNTGEMFLYWWGRRNADGTIEQFHDILETVYEAYYSE